MTARRAISLRSSGGTPSHRALPPLGPPLGPPFLPPLRPISRKKSKAFESSKALDRLGVFFAMLDGKHNAVMQSAASRSGRQEPTHQLRKGGQCTRLGVSRIMIQREVSSMVEVRIREGRRDHARRPGSCRTNCGAEGRHPLRAEGRGVAGLTAGALTATSPSEKSKRTIDASAN